MKWMCVYIHSWIAVDYCKESVLIRLKSQSWVWVDSDGKIGFTKAKVTVKREFQKNDLLFYLGPVCLN